MHDFGDSGISGGTYPRYPQLIGVEASTGQIQFATAHAGQGDSGSRPTVLGNQVVALGGYFGGMDSYDASTGAHQWFTQLPPQYGFIPAMDQQRVYIYYGSAGAVPGPQIGTLYVLDRASGEIEYTIQNPFDTFTAFSSISSVTLGGQDDALVINNISYINGESHDGPNQVTCFDLQQHKIKWSQTLDAVNALAVSNGEIAVPLPHALQMINETTGSDLWTWMAPCNVALNSNVVLTDNLAFIASQDTVFGIDRASGQLEWSAFLGTDNNFYSEYDLAYFDRTLYVSGTNEIFTFNTAPEPSGVLLWSTVLVALCGYSVLLRRQGVFHVPTRAV